MAYVFLFDCDGMTIDSEYVAMGIMADHVIQNRPHVGREEVMNMFGMGGKDILDTYGLHNSTIDAELHHKTVQALSRECVATPGMSEFMEQTDELILQGIVRVKAIVTSSGIDRVVGGLIAADMMRFYQKTPILSAESNLYPPRNKPDPAIYNLAKQTVQVGHDDTTVAFEDSVSGVKAAKAAQIDIIIGCLHGRHMAAKGSPQRAAHIEKLREAGATHIVDDMQQIWPLLDISMPARISRAQPLNTAPLCQQ